MDGVGEPTIIVGGRVEAVCVDLLRDAKDARDEVIEILLYDLGGESPASAHEAERFIQPDVEVVREHKVHGVHRRLDRTGCDGDEGGRDGRCGGGKAKEWSKPTATVTSNPQCITGALGCAHPRRCSGEGNGLGSGC